MLPAAPRPAPLWPPEGVASSWLPRGWAGPVIPAPPHPAPGIAKRARGGVAHAERSLELWKPRVWMEAEVKRISNQERW